MNFTSNNEARVPDPLVISGLILLKGDKSACARFTRWFYTQHRTVKLSGSLSRKHSKPKVLNGISSETEEAWQPSMFGTKECLCRIVNANKRSWDTTHKDWEHTSDQDLLEISSRQASTLSCFFPFRPFTWYLTCMVG